MYTREEASQLRQAFWTTFGQYISPLPSADGAKVNWLNYKTGLKNVYFRMDADKKHGYIAIEMSHPDLGIQEIFFEQFKELKNIFESYLQEEWVWTLHNTDVNGRIVSRISKEIYPVNIFNRDDWPTLIAFFKPRIIALDDFWSVAKDAFESLK
jgi:hypothetical protein